MDESLITGEPNHVHKEEGDTVMGGTINQAGSFVVGATHVGSDASLS